MRSIRGFARREALLRGRLGDWLGRPAGNHLPLQIVHINKWSAERTDVTGFSPTESDLGRKYRVQAQDLMANATVFIYN